MSHEIVPKAYKTRLGNLAAKSVFALIADQVNAEGFGWPSIDFIAKGTEVNERTVRRMIQVFAEMKLLSRVDRGRKCTPGIQLNMDLLGLDLRKEFADYFLNAQGKTSGSGSGLRDREGGLRDRSEVVSETGQVVSETGEAVSETEKAVSETKPPHPHIGRPAIDPLEDPLGDPLRARAPVSPERDVLRPVNPDAGEEIGAAVWFFEELAVPSDFGMRNLAAQAIRMQAAEWGGIQGAAERILVTAKNAKVNGEIRWRFWFTDQGYLDKQGGRNGAATLNKAQQRSNGNIAAAQAAIRAIESRRSSDRPCRSAAGGDQHADFRGFLLGAGKV